MAGKLTKKKEEDVVKEAKNFADAHFSNFNANNTKYKEQTKFWLDMKTQWTGAERSLLTKYNKIPLVCPKVYGIGRRILGEQRQATPDLQVRAITPQANQKAIVLKEDMIRTISSHSNAKIAYQNAFQNVLFGGYGAIKVVSEYEKPNSFDQALRIKPIYDPTICFWDPTAKEISKCDGMGCGEYLQMSRRQFEKEHPDITVPDSETLPTSGQIMSSKETVCILIYQRKEPYKKKIVQLTSGEVLDIDKYEERVTQYIEEAITLLGPEIKPEEIEIPEELRVIKKRMTDDYKIRTYKIAGNKVIEHSTWPSKYFSYIFVDGDSIYLEGKQITRSFFEDASDLQRFANYLFTQINHLIKAQRNEQWIGSPANTTGFEKIWDNPELTQGMLYAYPDMNRGGALPTRIDPVPISPSLTMMYDRIMQDINTTLGIYDAYEGNKGNEVSGKAIDSRVRQGNISTYTVYSNLNRGLSQVGAVILDAIPRVYDTQRPMSLKARDGSNRSVMLNEMKDGEMMNDTSGEDFYIEIGPGASFEGQREEALNSFRELLQINPAVSTVVADLFAENLPLQNVQTIVKRLRATLVPPEVVAAGNDEQPPPKEPPPPPPDIQLMEKDLELRKERQQFDAQKSMKEIEIKEKELVLKQEKLDLEKAKAGFFR